MGFSLNPRHVQGELFTDTGKWKYTVQLDYTDCDYNSANLWGEARTALACATNEGTSGVTFREIPEGWVLVVLEPYSRFEHPIMVKGVRPMMIPVIRGGVPDVLRIGPEAAA